MDYLTINYENSHSGGGHAKEQVGTEVINEMNYIIDEPLDPLNEGSIDRVEKVTCKSEKCMEGPEDVFEKRLRTIERKFSRIVKKRVKKMGKRIMEQQKSMMNDIFLLCKERADANETNEILPVENNMKQEACEVLETPITNMEKFTEFEQKLKSDAKLQNNLISSFLGINCTSPGEYIRICWSKILTDEVAAKLSWSITSTKNSICNRLITKTIKKAFALKFPLNQEKFNTVTQKHFQYAKDRTVKLDLNADIVNVPKPIPIPDCLTNSEDITKELQPSSSPKNNVKTKDLPNHQQKVELSKEPTTVSSMFKTIKVLREDLKEYGIKKPPKTSAQRSREYRLRKKRSTIESDRQNQSNDSSTSLPFTDCTINTNTTNSQEVSLIEKKIVDNNKQVSSKGITAKIYVTDYGFSNQSDFAQSSQTNDDTSQEYGAILYDESFWKPPAKCNVHVKKNKEPQVIEFEMDERSKGAPKSSAERSRAYRIRKRMRMAATLQREQLEIECFSNVDPLSQDSMNFH